jgi:hypothetical protein
MIEISVDFKHRDIVRIFLSFVLHGDFTDEDVWFYLKFHHQLNENESWSEYIKTYTYP